MAFKKRKYKTKKGKILIVVDSLGIGGAEQQVVIDANLLLSDGWEIDLVFWEKKDFIKEINSGVKLLKLPSKKNIHKIFSLLKVCYQNKYDLIYSHLTKSNFYSAIVGALMKIPVVVTEHGLGLWRINLIKYKLVVFITFKLASRIICVCEAVRQLKIQKEGACPGKTTVINNSFNLPSHTEDLECDLRTKYGFDYDIKIIGFVGRLVSVKRLDLLVKIAKEVVVKYNRVMFLIIGDGPCRASLEKQVLEAGLQNYFRFLGYQSKSQLWELYKLIEISALVSESEAQSMFLLESAGFRIPGVAFDIGGNKEVILTGETGFIVKFPDCINFADNLLCLLTDNSLRDYLGIRAKQRIETEFSSEQRIKHLEELFYQLKKG